MYISLHTQANISKNNIEPNTVNRIYNAADNTVICVDTLIESKVKTSLTFRYDNKKSAETGNEPPSHGEWSLRLYSGNDGSDTYERECNDDTAGTRYKNIGVFTRVPCMFL